MAEIGSGSGSSYPSALDSDSVLEVNSPNTSKTKARAEVANDLAAAIIAIETELGTDPAGTLADVKTFLQTEHGVDGTHSPAVIAKLAGEQTFTGKKRFSANVVWSKGADIASAATLNPGTDGNYFDVTGTTGITAIASIGVGTIIKLHTDGALTFTHHATDLILPNGADILTIAGDELEFIEYATGQWRMTSGARINTSRITDSAVTTAKIADANISQSKLKTTTGEVSLYCGDNTITTSNTILPGGEYQLGLKWKSNSATADEVEAYAIPCKSVAAGTLTSVYVAQIALYYDRTASGGGATLTVQQRYIQASPPYESYRKNDAVPLFVFGLVEKSTGKIIATYVAPEPPWANSGPTIINPLGQIQRIRKQKSGISMSDLKSGKTKPKDFGFLLENFEEPTKEELKAALAIPITQEDKNADMPLIPHPFNSYNPATQVVVILSPTDEKFCNGLSRLHEMGESVSEVLYGDYITIDNTPMEKIVTPKSVMAVGARWK